MFGASAAAVSAVKDSAVHGKKQASLNLTTETL